MLASITYLQGISLRGLLPSGGSVAYFWMVTDAVPAVAGVVAPNPRKTGVRAHNPRTARRRQ